MFALPEERLPYTSFNELRKTAFAFLHFCPTQSTRYPHIGMEAIARQPASLFFCPSTGLPALSFLTFRTIQSLLTVNSLTFPLLSPLLKSALRNYSGK